MSFNDLRVSTKLWLAASAILIALLLLVGFVGARQASLQAQTDTSLRNLNAKARAATVSNSTCRLCRFIWMHCLSWWPLKKSR